MRTLTPLILLPLVVLAPLLMAPTAYAIEVEAPPTVFVTVQSNELVEVNSPEVKATLELWVMGNQGRGRIVALLGSYFGQVNAENLEAALEGTETFTVFGTVVMGTGVVTRSTDADLIRTPVAITANATNGVIALVLGPVPSGRLAGQTFTFKGVGTALIVCLDCRSD